MRWNFKADGQVKEKTPAPARCPRPVGGRGYGDGEGGASRGVGRTHRRVPRSLALPTRRTHGPLAGIGVKSTGPRDRVNDNFTAFYSVHY